MGGGSSSSSAGGFKSGPVEFKFQYYVAYYFVAQGDSGFGSINMNRQAPVTSNKDVLGMANYIKDDINKKIHAGNENAKVGEKAGEVIGVVIINWRRYEVE